MSEPRDTLAQQIAALEAALQLPLPEDTRQRLMADLQALQAASAPAGDVVGDLVGGDKVLGDQVAGEKRTAGPGAVTLSDDARLNGVAVGVNLGTIVYGRLPHEDERRQLAWYLAGLANKLYRLPLRGLDERLDQGKGLALPQVYVMLATQSHIEVAHGSTKELQRYFVGRSLNQPLKEGYNPDQALPDRAIVRVEPWSDGNGRRRSSGTLPRVLWRSCLATEAVQQHARLVLLGDPGSGKSTFLRYLAWALARRGLDQSEAYQPCTDGTLSVGCCRSSCHSVRWPGGWSVTAYVRRRCMLHCGTRSRATLLDKSTSF